MEYIGNVRDVTGAPNFKEISNFLNFLQETFAPLLGHRDADVTVKHSNEKLPIDGLHKSSKKQSQRIPDVKSRDEFPALGVSVKKISPRTPTRLRRINPTPVGKLTTTTSHFTSSPLLNVTPVASASSLQEERRLLVEERSRQGSKKQNKSVKLTEIKSSIVPATEECTVTGVDDNVVSKEDNITDGTVTPSLSTVTDKTQLDSIAQCYSSLLKEMLVPNITSELYFLLQLLTVNASRVAHCTDMKSPFSTVSNCVYFAVAVISNVSYLFCLLDGQVLYLLSQCPRIEEFSPDLGKYFLQCHQMKDTQNGGGVSPDYHVFGVPFQAELDNRKNFMTDKAFHSFKKQRDIFYELLKDWQKDEDKQHGLSQREKMKSLMECDSLGLPHFAKLFQRQLVENSRHGQKIYKIEESENALVSNLKKSNPNKFLRLHERFSKLSSHGGPCPSPCFTQQEQFYTEFLLATDSYVFNQLLKQQLFSEISKLNERTEFENTKELSDVIMTLRVLAKYLGFLIFLPYQNVPVTTSSIEERSQVEPYGILQCVRDCYTNSDKLCVTIPWVVEFCGMMDTHAPTVPHYRHLLTSLIVIYRSLSAGVVEGDGSLTTGHMLLLTSLGWLFELHAVTNGIFHDEMQQHNDTTCNCTMSSTMKLVDDTLLLKCCPYLGELHRVLTEFAAGRTSRPHKTSVRKIKPMSVISEDALQQKKRHIQAQLQENFFRNQPSYLKKLCEVVAERIFSNVVTYSEQQILPCCVLIGLKDLVDVIKQHISSNSEDMEYSLNIAMTTMAQTAQKCSSLVIQRSHDHFDSYCRVTVYSSLQPLLVDTPSELILDAVTNITVAMAKERYWKWIRQEARGLACKQLEKQFVSMKKTISVAMKKSSDDRTLRSEEYLSNEDCYKLGGTTATTVDQLPGYDVLKDKLKQLKSSVNDTSFDRGVNELTQAIRSVTRQLAKQLFISPDVLVGQLLPICCSELVSISVKLTVQSVSCGRLRWSGIAGHSNTREVQTIGCSLLETLIHLWRLLKTAAVQPPLSCDQQLLSHEAFQLYITKLSSCSTIWCSLSETLLMLLYHNVCSSSTIEALWMCRIDELNDSPVERDHCLRGASVFLELFYTSSSEDVMMTSLSSGSVMGRVPGTMMMKDVHFVRLLSIILESGITDTSIVLRSRTSVSKLIHPI